MNLTYYASKPASDDKMWCTEVAAVADWCQGEGVDPGAGTRTISDTTFRVDINPDYKPDHVGSALHLPLKDSSQDYVFSSHLLEHMPSPIDALTEWLRVLKPGGFIATILPDTRFTYASNSDPTPHYFEWAPQEFLEGVLGVQGHNWWNAMGALTCLPAELVAMGQACPAWSFYFVLKKL